MMLDRRSALAGVLLAATIAGCDGSHSSATQPATEPASSTVQSSTAQSLPVQSAAAASSATRPATGAASTSAPAATVTPPPSAITVPAHLCSGTDAAQNAADAFMGALSAGNLAEALACLQPNTVPEAVTRSLLATAGSTAVYLPRDGVDGPAVFGYQGNGKSIDVTVSLQPDGQFRVTKLAVRGG